jgi:hypothetical protein
VCSVCLCVTFSAFMCINACVGVLVCVSVQVTVNV